MQRAVTTDPCKDAVGEGPLAQRGESVGCRIRQLEADGDTCLLLRERVGAAEIESIELFGLAAERIEGAVECQRCIVGETFGLRSRRSGTAGRRTLFLVLIWIDDDREGVGTEDLVGCQDGLLPGANPAARLDAAHLRRIDG